MCFPFHSKCPSMNLFCTFLGGPRFASGSTPLPPCSFTWWPPLYFPPPPLYMPPIHAPSATIPAMSIQHGVAPQRFFTPLMTGTGSSRFGDKQEWTPWHRNRTPNSIWSKKVTKTGTVCVTTQHIVGRNLWSNH